MTTGRLAGIARRNRHRGAMQVVQRVMVTCEQGVAGEYRGVVLPGKAGLRQISLLEAESWAEALSELAAEAGLADEVGPGATVPWQERRANLLVQGIRLPRETGGVIAIGASLRIAVSGECNPCGRMDEVAPGLMTALLPDWRGGALGRVIADGEIAVGDPVWIVD